MHQNKELRAKGRGAPRALEVLNLGLATDCNTSGYKLLIIHFYLMLISFIDVPAVIPEACLFKHPFISNDF
jgi:hypothetical protein